MYIVFFSRYAILTILRESGFVMQVLRDWLKTIGVEHNVFHLCTPAAILPLITVSPHNACPFTAMQDFKRRYGCMWKSVLDSVSSSSTTFTLARVFFSQFIHFTSFLFTWYSRLCMIYTFIYFFRHLDPFLIITLFHAGWNWRPSQRNARIRQRLAPRAATLFFELLSKFHTQIHHRSLTTAFQ